MLRSFSTDRPYRSLSPDLFNADGSTCVLGKNTLIYGQNGAGKTSFSEMLRQGSCPAKIDDCLIKANLRLDGENRSMELSSPNFPLNFAVYNRYYVAESLELFLAGEGSSEPIPVLHMGESSVATEKRLRFLKSLISARNEWHEKATKAEKEANKEIKRLENDIKALVIQSLSPGEPGKYNTSSYRVTKIRKNLENADEAKVLQEADLDARVKIASESARSTALIPEAFPQMPHALGSRIQSALTREVESQVIPKLAESQLRSDWTEAGVELHSPGDECKFCQNGTVTAEILGMYQRHFSKALAELRTDLSSISTEIKQEVELGDSWLAKLPLESELLLDRQDKYKQAVNSLSSVWEILKENRSRLIRLLEKRLSDPLLPLTEKDGLEVPTASPKTSNYFSVLADNNEACATQVERKESAQQIIEDHYAATYAEAHAKARSLEKRSEQAQSAVESNLYQLQQEYNNLLLTQQDTGPMAQRIDSDLRYHFGHGHISVAQSDDGKGYVVKRGNKIATDLSEGERNAIAYLYFLASLEADGIDKSNTVVVVDDPVTSLDRESLFAAFGVQATYLEDFVQTIFLTHDYEFFRLQVSHLESRYKRSQRQIREQNESEFQYPKVSISEIKAKLNEDSQRESSLRALSQELLMYSSEYHYLFYKVANAIRVEAHDEFPLLGNAARRLIEGFIAFQAPHKNTFGERVSSIALQRGVDESLTKRVVKFMHGQSHRANPNPVAGLDFPSIEDELSAVIRFMYEADEEHFNNMCLAVKIDKSEFSFPQSV